MEPGLRGREDRGGRDDPAGGPVAAMEPGLRGREDPLPARVTFHVVRSRYGARPSGPGRPGRVRRSRSVGVWPLWSPAFGAGKTGRQTGGRRSERAAAMEPGRRGRHPDRRGSRRHGDLVAAMAPGLRGREDRRPRSAAGRPPRRRYGARPSGPGRRERPHGRGARDGAAMEPGLRGREDRENDSSPRSVGAVPLWSPAFGAGKTLAPVGGTGAGARRRYGARPSGPGRPPVEIGERGLGAPAAMEPGLRGREDARRHPRVPPDRRAAMEPGLRGREDILTPGCGTGSTSGPLWSPAFGAGKTISSGSAPPVSHVPLWSPAFGAGKTRRPAGRPGATAGGRYGARPSGPGRLPDDPAGDHGDLEAAMEPGLRGREDATPSRRGG